MARAGGVRRREAGRQRALSGGGGEILTFAGSRVDCSRASTAALPAAGTGQTAQGKRG